MYELNRCLIALTALAVCPLIFQLASGLAIDQSAPGRQLNSLTTTNSITSNQSPSSPAANSDDQKMHDVRRPIWNLAHMVNSIKELDYRLGKGANAIEADVTFGRDGDPLFTYHGPPCDCWRHCHQREDFNDYLSYVREIAIEDREEEEQSEQQHQDNHTEGRQQLQLNGRIGQNLTLLFLDLKLDYLNQKGKARAGAELAKSVLENLFIDKALSSPSPNSSWSTEKKHTTGQLRLILSVNHVSDVELVNNFIYHLEKRNSSHLLERIGFDVGMNDDLQQIETMWRRFGNTLNLWQGDGYTNCISPFYNLERLTKALLKRNQDFGYPKKVYQWTIDLHDRMRESLQLGVDAIMTNHPERLLSVLSEPDVIHNYRLATKEDNPFEKIVQRLGSRNGGDQVSARYQRSANPPRGGFFRSLMDVINSWVAYMKEIPFLSFTTSRLVPRVKRHRQKSIIPQIVNPNRNFAPLVAKRNGDGSQEPHPLKEEASEQTISNSRAILAPSNLTTSSTINNGSTARRNAQERSSLTISDDITISTNSSGSSNSNSSSEQDAASNEELAGTMSQQPYEGPKWYTSLVSNVLVSMLKIALPASW